MFSPLSSVRLERPFFLLAGYFGLLLLVFTECRNTERDRASAVVTRFYASPGSFRDTDTSLLSARLRRLVASALDYERRDAERIKASAYPTDKPMLMEGAVFTSLYEGHEAYLVEQVDLKGNRAVVKISFSNLSYNKRWLDEVHLVQEHGWKIDDVVFGEQKAGFSSTSQLLNDFLVSDSLPTPVRTAARTAP